MHILIVEDERPIAENIYDFLEARGHRCDFAVSLADARRLLAQAGFDALILDRTLPDGDGLMLAQSLRDAGKRLPILMLTARDTLDDKLAGFSAGVDDYLVKPFALKEVEARLTALARRASQHNEGGALRCGNLAYDQAEKSLRLDGQQLQLPPKALSLATLLLAAPGRVFSRRELETAIWGEEQETGDNLRNLLYTLRKALGSDASVEIATMHGLGVKLVER
jgi:two-component system response regulator QseB